jgi:hypothetical protein
MANCQHLFSEFKCEMVSFVRTAVLSVDYPLPYLKAEVLGELRVHCKERLKNGV